MSEHVDVLIVGAGVSGIGAACHLTRDVPGKSYLILERRQSIGGTWDLFRYPGIRSDSDMFTFGYNFRPWNDSKVLADGPSIRAYVEETARDYRVTDKIRFGLKVTRADWSSADRHWNVEAIREETGETETFTASFVIACTGYYNYDGGYRPAFPGEDRFTGPIIHPQHWPTDLDYAGKRVVVIGSGATAVTLVPAMAPGAEHVTMLQRSPTYIVSLPAVDKISAAMRKRLSAMTVYRLSRIRNIGVQRFSYALSRSRPDLMRKIIVGAAKRQLGPDGDVSHFTPTYNPWDQRLCVVPDGDLFRSIRSGRASVVTDQIETFTEGGIRLASGREIQADIIVSATGLEIQMLGGAGMFLDGEPVPINEVLTYKSVMVEGVPNAAMIFGYTNASWTLKADIASEYVCRLIKHMDGNGYDQVVAVADSGERTADSILGSLDSGYVKRGNAQMPRQGRHAPWIVLNNYVRDAPMLRFKPIEDGILRFTKRGAQAGPTHVPRHEAALS